nr:uncharacterized protein LOC129257095 [Lytechinus pictus]
MGITYYIVLFIQIMSTLNYGLAALGGGTPVNGVDPEWQAIVSGHLCPLFTCEEWCDCSEMESNFVFGNSTIEVSPTCCNSSFSADGKLKRYIDCDALQMDQAYFRWWPTGRSPSDNGRSCQPIAMAGALLERKTTGNNGLYWNVCLTESHCLNVTDLCSDLPPQDSCSICTRDTTSVTDAPTPRLPGEGTLTTTSPDQPMPSGLTPDQTESRNTGNSSHNTQNGHIPDQLRIAFIIGVGVGVGVAVLSFILVCCLVIYIRRKMNRNRNQDQQTSRTSYQVDSNQYSTIERPLHNGNGRAMFTISPQSSVDSGSPRTKRKMKKKKSKKPLIASSDMKLEPLVTGPYTEYYANRSLSSYAGLQSVASESALVKGPFNIFAEYQEPDLVMPKSVNMCMFEDKRMSTSSSFGSFKLPGEYIDPVDINGPNKSKAENKDKEPEISGGSGVMSPDQGAQKHFKQRGDENATTSPMWQGKLKGKQKKIETSASCKETSSRQSPSSPDIPKDGALFQELVATLSKKKKPVSKSESTPLDIEGENPYAEVSEAFFSNESPRVSRQRSHSQPMVSTLAGYRTYEEIKPMGHQAKNKDDRNDVSVFAPANPYFELEDPNASRTHYFELENLNEETSNQQYFVLEKPSSLPLDSKKKKKGDEQKALYDQYDKTATLYQNDKCAVSGSGFRHNHFDLCVDNDSNTCQLNGVNAKAPMYFQLDTPRERSSLGSMAQEYMGSSENEFGKDRSTRAEGTLTFYPGGRKRASTYSLEEQAYDKLNRSARSSRSSNRRSMINTGSSTPPDGPYSCISVDEEYNQIPRLSKNKSVKKK